MFSCLWLWVLFSETPCFSVLLRGAGNELHSLDATELRPIGCRAYFQIWAGKSEYHFLLAFKAQREIFGTNRIEA